MTNYSQSESSRYALLEGFLLEKDWFLKSTTDSAKIYAPPSGKGFDDGLVVLMPTGESLDAGDRYFNDLTRLITEIYRQEFIDYVAQCGDDSILPWVIRSRLVHQSIGRGTIPLQKLDKFISNLSKSLYEIAKFKLPVEEQLQKALAQKFVDGCEFLPTEAGSFIASIKVPSEIIREKDFFSESIKSSEILLGWFSAIEFLNDSVIKNEASDNIPDDVMMGAIRVLNIPVAESLEGLISDAGISSYEFEAASGARKIISTTGDLNKDSLSRLSNFIKLFKEKLVNEDELEVEGKIFELRSRNPSGNKNHIAIKADFYGDSVIISMNLNNEDYQKACEAHKEAKTVVVKGSAVRLKTQLRMSQLSSFEIKG